MAKQPAAPQAVAKNKQKLAFVEQSGLARKAAQAIGDDTPAVDSKQLLKDLIQQWGGTAQLAADIRLI